MSILKSLKAGSTPFKSKGDSPEDGDSQSLFSQCPICFNSFIKSSIQQHVESCLQRHAGEEETKEIGISDVETREKGDDTTSEQRNVLPDMPSAMTTPEKKIEMKKRNGGEWKPLAERMRPTNFEQMAGDSELFSKESVVRALFERDPPPSIILCGPPGCGKTSVANVIARHTRCPFVNLSCCTSTVEDIKSVATKAENEYRLRGLPTVLFMDEIHRFSTKQQDIFLPYVEQGTLVLIGATTESPSFTINSALLSRCQVIPLKLLTNDELVLILKRALENDEFLKSCGMTIDEPILNYIALKADGDARIALNLLDDCSRCGLEIITTDMIDCLVTEHFIRYDRNGEEHHNSISALHKAIRGSDVQASIYWLSRMLEGGENPLYVARRLVRCSTEDIGLADPQALIITTNCFQICKELGAPLCFNTLAQTVTYLALTSKSNELYLAYGKVADIIHESGAMAIPSSIMQTGEYDYSTGKNYLPEGIEHETMIHVNRATTDLRAQSINRYIHPNSEVVGPIEADANLSELPLEKRMKITVESS